MKDGQWMCNFTGSEYWNDGEYFDTKEEAIEYGKARIADLRDEDEYNLYGTFAVGQLNIFIPSVDVDNILESITDQANDACGEFAENYLGYVNAKEKSKLEDMLSKALQTWLDETGNQPSFFTIENSEAIKVE